MKKFKNFQSFLLLFVALLTMSIQPFAASASEVDKAETEAGIGFNTKEEEPTLPSTSKEPTQPSNVRTPSTASVRSQARIYRRLPQTNMQSQFLMTLVGGLLVALILIIAAHRDRKKVRPVE